jgi:Transposase family tnp2
VNPTGTTPDGDQTVPTVNDDVIDDQIPDGDEHTPLPTVNEINAPDRHPEGEHDTNQCPDADQESFRPPTLELDEGEPDTRIYIPALQITMNNIQALKNATLDASGMAPDDVNQLRDPQLAFCGLDMSDTHLIKSLQHFIYSTDMSHDHYETICKVNMTAYPDDEFLLFDQAKRTLKKLSGVVPIRHDCCISSCATFTGAYSDLNACPYCNAPHYDDNGKPCRQFTMIPISPVLQALYMSPETAEDMHYLEKRLTKIEEHLRTHNGEMESYDDMACSQDLLQAWASGQFTKDDITLQLSIDGAQLYRDRTSDCWIFIWIIHNLPPGLRYKKAFVIPGSFVPGKPKEMELFLFPSLYHIAAIQRKGLKYFDASTSTPIPCSIPLVMIASADGPGSTSMSGFVGHSGKQGC